MTRDKFIESSLSTGVGVPDGSGGRSGNRIHKAYQRGGSKYPYDKAAGGAEYGVPLAYDRGSSGNGGSRQNVNVPKNVGADASTWDNLKSDDLKEVELDGTPIHGNVTYDPGEKSRFGDKGDPNRAYADEVDEALGVPYNSKRGGQGTGGAHTGGRVAPGTSGEWSAGPKGGSWDNHMTDIELNIAARQDEYNYGPIRKTSSGEDPLYDRIPQAPMGDVELDKGAVILKVGGAGFGNHGGAMKQARMSPGLTWRESRHRGLVEAFVSLKDTPQGCTANSASTHDVDRDIETDRFRSVHDQSKASFGDESDMIKLMMKIEPNYFANSLGKIGKDELMDIYEQWIDEVLSNEDDIGKMTERIMMACGEKR